MTKARPTGLPRETRPLERLRDWWRSTLSELGSPPNQEVACELAEGLEEIAGKIGECFG
uniref:Uncharacterized protein n=1 Tax=Oryza sativa subsp. japonica TaxID=39947 RepID=Q6K429_ORYSJ|nr:hypothetical protein [Oryza sativa Japonica Group]BAD22320.1 hypothetical protein [Oryza sativa Japonica Group]